MKRIVLVLGVALLALTGDALAQAQPDLSGTWKLNQQKSTPGVAGNTPNIAFPSQIVVKQTPTDLTVASTSVRQSSVSATYKLDGTKVNVAAPSGLTETGAAKFEGSNLVIMSVRSFSSPAGDTVVNFKETWTVNGNVLTIEKSRIEEGGNITEKGVYDKIT
jgi:hypothetical protein